MLTWTLVVSILVLGVGCLASENLEDQNRINDAKLHGLTEAEYDNLKSTNAETHITLNQEILKFREIIAFFARSVRHDFAELFEGYAGTYDKVLAESVYQLEPIIYAYKENNEPTERITFYAKNLLKLLSEAVGKGYMAKITKPFRDAYGMRFTGSVQIDDLDSWRDIVREGLAKLNGYNLYELEDGADGNSRLISLDEEIKSLGDCQSLEELKEKANLIYQSSMLILITQINDRARKEMLRAIATIVNPENREVFDYFASRIFGGIFFNPAQILNHALKWTDGFGPNPEDYQNELGLRNFFSGDVLEISQPDTVFIPLSSLQRLI